MAFGLSTKKDVNNLRFLAQGQYDTGVGLTDEGLGDLRTISGDYRDLIRKGGLTDAVNREYDVQQGRISDDVIRAGRSFRATLAQEAAQNGGYLSPAAQAELARRNEADTNEQAFTARNQLSFEKARVAQDATRTLQDRVLQIADMIRTSGLTREQLGYLGMFQAAQAKLEQKRDTLHGISLVGGLLGIGH